MVLLLTNHRTTYFLQTSSSTLSTFTTTAYQHLLHEHQEVIQPLLPSFYQQTNTSNDHNNNLHTSDTILQPTNKHGMCRRIQIFCTPDDQTTVVDLALVIRGVAKVFVIVLFLSIAQLGISSSITRETLPWRLTAILLYILNILTLQIVGLEPSIGGCNCAILSVAALIAFDLADFTTQLLTISRAYWSSLSMIAAIIQTTNLYIIILLRRKLIIIKENADDALRLPQGAAGGQAQAPEEQPQILPGVDPVAGQFIQGLITPNQNVNDEEMVTVPLN